MSGMKSGLVLSGILFCLSFGLVWASDDTLVSAELLSQAGFKPAWQIQLPLQAKEQLDKLYISGDYLYALSSRNYFFCIKRSDGTVGILPASQTLANPSLPVRPPLDFGKHSVFLVGQELKVFDPVSCRIVRTVMLEELDGTRGGVARNDLYAYVCGSQNRLCAFSADEGVPLFTVTADDDSPIQSVLASNEMVWFGTAGTATTNSSVIAIAPRDPRKIWQFDLSGEMVTPLVSADGFIYAAGLDAKLYKLNAGDGTLAWEKPFLVGGPVKAQLVLGKKCVYVYTANTGLHAVDKATSKEVWPVMANGYSVLAERGDLSYIYVQPGILSVMDNAKGKEVLSINTAGIDRFAVNMVDSSVYLARKDGRIMAAAPLAEDNNIIPKP